MIIIPVYNAVLLPDVDIYFKTDFYKEISQSIAADGDRVLFLSTKEQKGRNQITEEDVYPIGVTGTVIEATENGYVKVRTQSRVNIDSLARINDGKLSVEISARPDIGDMSAAEQKEHLEKIKGELLELVAEAKWGPLVHDYVLQWNSIAEIMTAMSPRLMNSAEDKYAMLAEDSIAKRTELMENMLYEFLEAQKVTNEAKNAQEEDHQKKYREMAIKKQMEYLQKELDELHPENVTDVSRFKKKIEEADMNEQARKEADKVLNRMQTEGQNNPEYGMLYDYLDFVTGLNWHSDEQKFASLDESRQILDEDHYGLKKVKKRILQQIAVMNLRQKQSGSILLFVGAPGTGKTSIGQSIARATGRKYVRVSLGGVRDEAEIRGHRRTYIGAMPGRIMDGIRRAGSANPVMVLDEIDKLSMSYNGDPASALLEVLDPEQNATFTDHYMNVPYDLSNVMFICTANSLDTIPEPLLNRMEVIQFPGYSPSDKFQIARKHLLPRAMEAMGISEDKLEVTDEGLRTIISDYTMEGGVRGLKKRMDTLCREAAVQIVGGDNEKCIVTEDNLRDFLDMRPIHHDRVLAQKKPGVVTGLAWTAAGGDILFIETMLTKGSGKVIITGQLGDVMKESAQIAVSMVKSMFPEQAELLEKNDLHIHVPDGAVPKDGPSAGITLTTALSSLITGKAVDPHFAMTGEISLRGGVMPIGGLPEKLMAAQRAGITDVFIPEENVDDLDDVADEVKSRLNIMPVSEITQVLSRVGILDPEDNSAIA